MKVSEKANARANRYLTSVSPSPEKVASCHFLVETTDYFYITAQRNINHKPDRSQYINMI
jgi:hypothetical protein